MKRILIVLGLLLMLGLCAVPTRAADPITITSNKFINNFRTNLKFELQAESTAGKINQVALYIQIDGLPSTARQVPEFTSNNQVQATYEWRLTNNYLPPGATGQFWWMLEDDAGGKLTTAKQTFRVEDLSKQWNKLANNQYALYWYNGSESFGKALFDRGVQAMEFLQKDLGITVDKQIQSYIYGDTPSFRNALQVGAQEWTGGVSFNDHSIILIHIEPNNLEWGKGATTHELTHQVIRQKISGPLGDLSMPRWINEGMAMYYQNFPPNLDSRSQNALNRAIQNDALPALRTLTGTFPADSAAANLAYSQSYSVVEFIFRQYGKDKIMALFQEFKKGGDYDGIFARVLGVNTDELDNEWRKSVGLKPRALPARAIGSPTPFPTFSLSTDDGSSAPKPTPTTAPRTTTAAPTLTTAPATTPVAQVTATPAQVAQVATPITATPTKTPSSSSNPLSQLCGGAFVMMILGACIIVWNRA